MTERLGTARSRSILGGRHDTPGHQLQIPIEAGRVFRRDAGQRSDMKPATIPN
jgi:hypothetical protein